MFKFIDFDYWPRKRTSWLIRIHNKKFELISKIDRNLHFSMHKIFVIRWPRN